MNTIAWSRRRDGAGIVHTTVFEGYTLVVTNWPGTRTLWIEYKNGAGASVHWEDLDKAETSVASAKQRALDWVLARKTQQQ